MIKKYSILLVFFTLGFINLSYACDKKITSKNFILFIDMNGGLKEIEEAKKAACEKGQELIVYPKQSAETYRLTSDRTFLENRQQALKCFDNPKKEKCISLKKKSDDIYEDFSSKVHKFSEDELGAQLKKLSEEGRYTNMLVMSGHGDSHSVFGDYGSSDNREIQNIFNDLDDQGKSVTSLIMLSCYSTNPSTIIEWKKNLPELKMIAGSDASAAASDRPAGLKYLKGLMTKVNEITADVDEKNLKKKLQNLIPTLNQINSSIYVDGNKCGEGLSEKRLFYSKAHGGVKVFNPEDCIQAEAEYAKKEGKIREYMRGKIAIPVETQGTELRGIYTFMRQNEHCLKSSQAEYSADMLYGLLFYNSVKINAVRTYKKEADEVNAVIEIMRNDPSPLYAQDVSDFEKTWPLNEENIRKKDRSEILQTLESLVRLGSTIKDQQVRISYFGAIAKLDKSLNDMTCISNQWHVEQQRPAAPVCREESEDEDRD